MQDFVLAAGPPPLTVRAADAALDAIDFIAAAVRGYDAIEVTDIVRPMWRAHLAYWYPQLPPLVRHWYADAPRMLMSIHAQWPALDPWQRSALVLQWSTTLPQLLWMVDPVLSAAQAIEMQQGHRSQLDDLRQLASSGRPSDADSEVEAVAELNRRSQATQSLTSFSTTMANSTISLMHALNR